MADVDFELNVDELGDGTHTGDYEWDVGEEEEELFWRAKEDDREFLAKLIYQYDYHPDKLHASLDHLCTRSALHTAVEHKHLACVAVLIKAGANVNLASERLPDKVLEEVMEMGMPEVREEDLDDDARDELYHALLKPSMASNETTTTSLTNTI